MRINNLIKIKTKNLRLIVLTAIAVILAISIATAYVYYYQGASLSGGSFNNTLYNATGQYVFLNYTDSTNTSYVTQGNYTSSVIDMGATTGFVEIKWKGRGSCPQNMSYINKFGGYCIDQYEAYNRGSSTAGSASGTTPWISVTQTAAATACANAGKHLCTSLEWLGAANIKGKVYNLPADLGSAPYYCNTNSKCGGAACLTMINTSNCVSAEGVYDMVGNVNEWTSEVVTSIKPATCSPGSSGYCYANSTNGWQTSTGSSTVKYGNDGVYFLAGTNAGRAVRRGGSWTDGASAGLFDASLNLAPSSTSSAFGFRCCSSPL